MDVNKQKQKKVLCGVTWRPEGLQMLKATTIDFVFSELPDEPAFHVEEVPCTEEFDIDNTLDIDNRDYWRAVKGDEEEYNSL